MINFNFDRDCCGCRTCADKCPQHCIEIVPNKYGYVIPHVDTAKCVDCGLCERLCPNLNRYEQAKVEPKVFSAYATDAQIRKNGSSGSIFYLLAKQVIEAGGIVFGAAFDDNLKLKHMSAETLDELVPLMRSKYLQSDTTGVYTRVQSELAKGRRVLFVGTPCQTVALNNVLRGKRPDNLLLVDFICHGVPSQQLFDKSIKKFEEDQQCKVTAFSFRTKSSKALHNYTINYVTHEGKPVTETRLSRYFPFYCGYLKYFTFRDSCYKCKYLGTQRVSDFTLGDFWFLDTIRPIDDFNKGYSMLIVNSQRAQSLLDAMVADGKVKTEEFPIDIAIKLNYAYNRPTHKSVVHGWFKHDYVNKPYAFVEKRYFAGKFTFWQKVFRIILKYTKL